MSDEKRTEPVATVTEPVPLIKGTKLKATTSFRLKTIEPLFVTSLEAIKPVAPPLPSCIVVPESMIVAPVYLLVAVVTKVPPPISDSD